MVHQRQESAYLVRFDLDDPQIAVEAPLPFETRLAGVEGEESAALLERERRFDSDLWVVEIETDEIGTLLTLVDQPKI